MDAQELVIEHLTAQLHRQRQKNLRSTQLYRERHRDKVNAISLAYYRRRKVEDPEWFKDLRERQRLYQKARRALLKQQRLRQEDSPPEITGV